MFTLKLLKISPRNPRTEAVDESEVHSTLTAYIHIHVIIHPEIAPTHPSTRPPHLSAPSCPSSPSRYSGQNAPVNTCKASVRSEVATGIKVFATFTLLVRPALPAS